MLQLLIMVLVSFSKTTRVEMILKLFKNKLSKSVKKSLMSKWKEWEKKPRNLKAWKLSRIYKIKIKRYKNKSKNMAVLKLMSMRMRRQPLTKISKCYLWVALPILKITNHSLIWMADPQCQIIDLSQKLREIDKNWLMIERKCWRI